MLDLHDPVALETEVDYAAQPEERPSDQHGQSIFLEAKGLQSVQAIESAGLDPAGVMGVSFLKWVYLIRNPHRLSQRVSRWPGARAVTGASAQRTAEQMPAGEAVHAHAVPAEPQMPQSFKIAKHPAGQSTDAVVPKIQ